MLDSKERDDLLWREIGAAVRAGRSIRARVRNATASAIQRGLDAESGIAGIARSALHAAATEATSARTPTDPLRQVVEGTADGFVVAAQALQMTVREATSRAAAFAQQDLDRAADEFSALAMLFVDSMVRGANEGGAQTAEVVQAVREHAHTALRRAWPAFAAAASTARRNPRALAEAAAEAAPDVARAAVGALQKALGEQLQKLGIALAKPPRGEG